MRLRDICLFAFSLLMMSQVHGADIAYIHGNVAPNGTVPSGEWFDVPAGTESPVNILPTNPAAFFRLNKR